MLKRIIWSMVGITFLWGTVSCGTIIYPERRGQQSGRIDVGVALLDGLGLLLFVIPGIVAYAVDFSTGAIYLPGTGNQVQAGDDSPVVQLNPDQLDWATISEAIEEHTGRDVLLSDPDLLVYQPQQEKIDIRGELAALTMDSSSLDWTLFRASETDFVFDSSGRLIALEHRSTQN